MSTKIIKNFSGSHEELMDLFRKAKEIAEQEESVELESMTMVQLKALAKDKGLRGYSRLNKAALINLIDISLKTLDDQ